MIISDERLNIIASHDSDSYRIVFVEDSEKKFDPTMVPRPINPL